VLLALMNRVTVASEGVWDETSSVVTTAPPGESKEGGERRPTIWVECVAKGGRAATPGGEAAAPGTRRTLQASAPRAPGGERATQVGERATRVEE